jgi:cell division GTPase FtsZ
MLEMKHESFMIGLGGAGQNIATSTPNLFPMSKVILANMDDRVLEVDECVAGRLYLGKGEAYSVEDVRLAIDDAINTIISLMHDADTVVIISGASGKTGSQAPYLAKKLLLANKKVALALMQPMAFESPRHYPQAIDDLNALVDQCFWHELFEWDLKIGGSMDQLVSKTNQHIMSRLVTRISHTDA